MINKKTEFISLLGSKIARLRKMSGYNQFEFADKSGKMVNTISKIERGIGDPRLSTLMDIAEALDISLTELLNLPTEEKKKSSPAPDSMEPQEIAQLISRCDSETLNLISALIKALSK